MEKKKKALAVVAGPYRFYQVLWLYTQFQDYEWDLLLLPFGNSDKVLNQLYSSSVALNIFRRVLVSKMTGSKSTNIEQIAMMMKMCFFFFIGQKKQLMKRLIDSQIGRDDYDLFFIGCEYSIIEGAIIGLSDSINVVIFEEGLGDYLPKKNVPKFSGRELVSYIVSKMGYFSPYAYFELKNTKYCTKYSSLPQLMDHGRYKEIKKLFTNSKNNTLFKDLIKNSFETDTDIISQYDVIFFTSTLDLHIKDSQAQIERLHQWFLSNYKGKRILIKKHPRDDEQYIWDDLDCEFYKGEVPAELFLGFIENHQIVSMGVSTVLLSLLGRTNSIRIIQFKDIHGYYEENINDAIKILKLEQEQIVLL